MKYVDCAMYSTLTCVEFALIVGAIMRVRRFKISQLPDQRRVQIKLLGNENSRALVNDNV